MYAPDELLEQLKKQVLSEFPDQIISFQWVHEQECSFVYVEVRKIALQIPLDDRISEIVYSIVGHPDNSQYIVPIHVWAVESIETTDGLFNLSYHGAGSNSFSVRYYPPEQDGLISFNLSIHYKKMFDAIRTIHLDSPAQLWERLVRPSREAAALRRGIEGFSKQRLAKELRDFLLKHLDFIKHIAEVTNQPLEILEPVIDTQSNNRKLYQLFVNGHQSQQKALALVAD